MITRGLGGGGDPQIGYDSAMEARTKSAKRSQMRGWFSFVRDSAAGRARARRR
jgi:cell division GTPase FtsZ